MQSQYINSIWRDALLNIAVSASERFFELPQELLIRSAQNNYIERVIAKRKTAWRKQNHCAIVRGDKFVVELRAHGTWTCEHNEQESDDHHGHVYRELTLFSDGRGFG